MVFGGTGVNWSPRAPLVDTRATFELVAAAGEPDSPAPVTAAAPRTAPVRRRPRRETAASNTSAKVSFVDVFGASCEHASPHRYRQVSAALPVEHGADVVSAEWIKVR
jgi:hypothetical protein